MRKRIRLLIDATGSSGWIGGVYHKKNILFSLQQNQWIRDNCIICVVTNPENKELFSEFEGLNISTISYSGLREKKIKIAVLLVIHRCTHLFPNIDSRICSRLHVTGINWVPDYQHYHYPEYFTESDLEEHRRTDIMTIDSGYPLILSSQSCLNDFRQYVSKTKENVYVVPFVSYIEKEVRSLSDDYVMEICSKFGVKPRGYIMVANQFWQHKNHTVVFEAIKRLSHVRNNEGGTASDDISFVFTGEVSDYRSDEYADRIRAFLDDPDISDRCICTGFIDRSEQLALMRGTRFLIQPSLFEGWGTVLEDAKVLDKRVILSDIPVHREQMNEVCTLFNPHDADELARLIVYNWNSQDVKYDSLDYGIETMYSEARQYSVGLEQLLRA